MKTFDKQQQREQCHKTWAEVISKYCEGQASFCDRIPWTLDQMLKINNHELITHNR